MAASTNAGVIDVGCRKLMCSGMPMQPPLQAYLQHGSTTCSLLSCCLCFVQSQLQVAGIRRQPGHLLQVQVVKYTHMCVKIGLGVRQPRSDLQDYQHVCHLYRQGHHRPPCLPEWLVMVSTTTGPWCCCMSGMTMCAPCLHAPAELQPTGRPAAA